MEQIKTKVIELVHDICNINIDDIRDNSELTYELGLDSLDIIELAMNLEKEFDITIDHAELPKNCTVYDIVKEVSRLIDAKNGKYANSGKKYIPTKEEIEETEKFNREKKAWYTFPLTFWELVEKLNWKENCNYPTKELQQKFYQLCEGNEYIAKYFDNTRKSYVNVLKTIIYDYELRTYGHRAYGDFFKGGDDSFDDLCNHIVGMGQEVTMAVLQNPALASEYFDSYVESFAYCFQID